MTTQRRTVRAAVATLAAVVFGIGLLTAPNASAAPTLTTEHVSFTVAGQEVTFTVVGDEAGDTTPRSHTQYIAELPYDSNGKIYARARLRGSHIPIKICARLGFTSPPLIPMGPVTSWYCSSKYYYSGSAWVTLNCGMRGFYFTMGWFRNTAGTTMATRTSKLTNNVC